jgi:hypothetical protein
MNTEMCITPVVAPAPLVLRQSSWVDLPPPLRQLSLAGSVLLLALSAPHPLLLGVWVTLGTRRQI